MKHNRITAALVMLATTSAFAQPTAQLKNVEGNVLVSTAQGAVAGANGLALPDKSLVTTTSNGFADVVTPAGCTISLKPNQRVEVDVTKTCEALAALVTAAPGAVALGAAGSGGVAAGVSGSAAPASTPPAVPSSSPATTEIHRLTSPLLLSAVVEKALAFLLGLFLCGVLYRGGNTPFAVQILGYAAGLVLLLSLSHTRDRAPAPSIASIALVVAFLALLISGLTGLFHVSVETWLALPARSYYQEVVQWHQLAQPDAKTWAISLDTVGTTQAILVAVAALAVCVGAFALPRPLVMKLLAVFVFLAIVEAVLGLLQYALSGPAFLSYSPMPQNRAIGTFINRNHFATWLSMSLPIVVLRTSGAFTFQSSDRTSHPAYWQVWWGFAAVLITAALLASASRAGSSAALIVTISTLCVIATRKMPGKRSLLLIAIVSTIALLVSETILPRFALAFSDEALRESSAGRAIMYARAFDAAKQFFPVGSGLGSFSIAFQRFQPPELEGLFIEHAHNDYIQLLFETGAAGVLILGLFAVSAVATAINLFRHRDDFHRIAPAVGCFLGAAAFAFHSLFDFPAHIPAVAIAATFLFTAAIRLSLPEPGSERRKPAVKPSESVATTPVEPMMESRRVRSTQGTLVRRHDPALEALFQSRDPPAAVETPREKTTDRPVDYSLSGERFDATVADLPRLNARNIPRKISTSSRSSRVRLNSLRNRANRRRGLAGL